MADKAYKAGFDDGCAHIKEDYAAGERLDALRIAELEAALTEAKMQSLADLGQAQDAYEAQKKAEAERDRQRENLETLAADYLNNCPDAYLRFAHKKMQETDND